MCTICTSDNELMLSTYMVTPTSTGGPGKHKNMTFFANRSQVCWLHIMFERLPIEGIIVYSFIFLPLSRSQSQPRRYNSNR